MGVPSLPLKAAKKRKNVKTDSSTPFTNSFHHQLISIESSLSTSSDLNSLYDLVQLIRDEKQGKVHTLTLQRAIRFLVKSLQILLNEERIHLTHADSKGLVQGTSSSSIGVTDANHAVASWLGQRWNDAIQLLCDLLLHDSSEVRLLALSSIMSLQRDASQQLSIQQSPIREKKKPCWSSSPWILFIKTLVTDGQAAPSEDILTVFAEDYLNSYDDVRYCFCKEVDRILRKPPSHLAKSQTTRGKLIEILWRVTAIPILEEDLNTFLVKEIEAGTPETKTKKKSKSNNDERGVEFEDQGEIEDWFSDSEEEESRKDLSRSNAGLGKAAQSASDAKRAKKQRRKSPPFHEAVLSLNTQKAAYSRAWLAILLPVKGKGENGDTMVIGGCLALTMMHETLVRMHSQILPHLVKPNLLHDFLVDCLDAGGATSLLALNTLYSLMTIHNLNYPSFYIRLYSLLLSDPPFLHVRYRSRFLRLLDTFLSSSHLPAALIASFIKRLSRVALRAPPAAIIVVIPFVWNLCKRHKQCLELLHREFGNDRFDAGPAGVNDPFNASEVDPLKTKAIESSLWELSAMGSLILPSQRVISIQDCINVGDAHYLANVSSLSKILAEPFTKERYDLEDFLDLTFTTLFEAEIAKSSKRRPGKKVIEPALVYSLANLNGKRLAFFGESIDTKRARMEAPSKEEREESSDDVENAKLTMLEVQKSSQVQGDACHRIFTFR